MTLIVSFLRWNVFWIERVDQPDYQRKSLHRGLDRTGPFPDRINFRNVTPIRQNFSKRHSHHQPLFNELDDLKQRMRSERGGPFLPLTRR